MQASNAKTNGSPTEPPVKRKLSKSVLDVHLKRSMFHRSEHSRREVVRKSLPNLFCIPAVLMKRADAMKAMTDRLHDLTAYASPDSDSDYPEQYDDWAKEKNSCLACHESHYVADLFMYQLVRNPIITDYPTVEMWSFFTNQQRVTGSVVVNFTNDFSLWRVCNRCIEVIDDISRHAEDVMQTCSYERILDLVVTHICHIDVARIVSDYVQYL
jgi:hypothetical protein